MTPNFKMTLPGLLLIVLLTLWLLSGCASPLTCNPTAGTFIPPLPEQARQATQSGCSPHCKNDLTKLRDDTLPRQTPTASPASPASAPMTASR